MKLEAKQLIDSATRLCAGLDSPFGSSSDDDDEWRGGGERKSIDHRRTAGPTHHHLNNITLLLYFFYCIKQAKATLEWRLGSFSRLSLAALALSPFR
jgi:hypothetical protein